MEDAARRFLSRPVREIFGAMLGLVLWAGVAGGQLSSASLQPYRAALERGQVGTLSGTAVIEPRKPREAPTPWGAISVVLLPASPRLLADLEAVKTHARDSAKHYLEAAGEVRRIKDAYELALVQAGAADLILRAATDAHGRFELPRVPAGEWVLLAWYEELHQQKVRRVSPKDARGVFLLEPLPSGYRAVTYWLLTRAAEAGGEIKVELTDRNPWMRGVIEEKTQGVIPKKTP